MNPITEMDVLAPFEIWEVPFDNGATIKFHEPLVLTPTWMPHDPDEPDENEYLQVIFPELAIDVYGENREDLLEAVHSNIYMNWKHYVRKDDRRLSPQTKAIKLAYLAVAEVIDG